VARRDPNLPVDALIVLDPKTHAQRVLAEGRIGRHSHFSPDESLLSFNEPTGVLTSRIVVMPITGPWPVPASDWIQVTEGTSWDDKPRWSPDGKMLYFISDRDGYRCLWAQRLDQQTHQPSGAAIAVSHFHASRRSVLNVPLANLELGVGPDRIVFPQAEVTGNIWLAKVH
jgi:hypothetical protein